MTRTVNISRMKREFSRLVQGLETGIEAEIIIVRNGRPVAKLVGIDRTCGVRIGVAQGRFAVPKDIDGPNPAIIRLFLAEPIG